MHIATAKALRSFKLFSSPSLVLGLLNNQAYQQHINQLDVDDPFVFISHKYYLVKGLATDERIRTAATHYAHETRTFNQNYLDVIASKKLVVWLEEFEGEVFYITLEHGNDVLFEGASSLVFYQNKVRICVISFSVVPRDTFYPIVEKNMHAESKNIIIVTRKQPTQDYSYQKIFNKAFDRTTPAHLCMAALSGYAKICEFNSFIGVSVASHPSSKSANMNNFIKAYDSFWESMHGEKVSRFGFLINLPLALPDLESMDAKSRKRAIARREHANKVTEAAYNILKNYLAN